MAKKKPYRGHLPHACHVKLKDVEHRLARAIEVADRRGYTGMVRSKGGLFDDPRIKVLMRRRNRLLAGKC